MPYSTVPPAGGSTPGGSPPALQAYRHRQTVPAAHWVIAHHLGFRPAGVLISDPDGNPVEGVIAHLDGSTTTVTFGLPISGIADLS